MKLERIQLFNILAFAPILVIFYYSPFSAIIPFYGFMLIILKHEKLVVAQKAKPTQMIVGAAIVLPSLFAYYAVVRFYPEAAPYSPANYVLHILGLFLLFFSLPALKEAFSPLFLITAATSSNLISESLQPFLSPSSDNLAHIVVGILRAFGVNATVYSVGNTPVVTFQSLSGATVLGAFVYDCIGVYSMLVFSIILVVILFEDTGSFRAKLTFAIIGLAGTIAINILRIVAIFLTDYFYGGEAGATVHLVIGYLLFSIWLAFFFLAYSKRHFFRRIWQHVKGKLVPRDMDAAHA